jgi:hypothetical protein
MRECECESENESESERLRCLRRETPHGFSPPDATPFFTISAFGSLSAEGGLTSSEGSFVLTVCFRIFSFAHGAVTSRSSLGLYSRPALGSTISRFWVAFATHSGVGSSLRGDVTSSPKMNQHIRKKLNLEREREREREREWEIDKGTDSIRL